MKTVGSTYVYAIDRTPAAIASSTIASGVTLRLCGTRPSRWACDICQFWQKAQWKLQPCVATEYA